MGVDISATAKVSDKELESKTADKNLEVGVRVLRQEADALAALGASLDRSFDEAVEALGGGRQPLVHVRLGEHAYRSRVAVRAGAYKLPVSAEHRAGAGVAAGDEVEVTLALDTEPRDKR